MIKMSSFFTTFEFKSSYFFSFFISIFNWSEFNVSISIICYCCNHNTIFVFKHKAEFVGFKYTAFQTFREVEFYWNRDVHNTFFSWFVWFLHCLACWIVLMYDLSRSVFNVHTIFNSIFHCSWDIKLVVTSEFEFSCVDHLCVFRIAKWLSEAIFKCCSNNTVVHSDIEFSCYIRTSLTIISFDCWTININFSLIVVIWDSYWLDMVFVVCVKFSCIQPYLVNKFLTWFNWFSVDIRCFVIRCIVRIWVRIGICVLVCQLFIII